MSGFALPALVGVQTIAGIAGQQRAARASEAQGLYEGSILDQNATLADEEAADAIARGHDAALKMGAETRGAISTSRASMAAQGLDLNVGSAADVQDAIGEAGALDEETIRMNARREAFGFTTEAQNYRNQANLARMGGKNTARAQKYASYNTLLTGATNLAGLAYGRSK